jgi:PAS domain S-box-containing protein
MLPLNSSNSIGELFAAVIDCIDVGVYVLDVKGTILRVNKYILDHYQFEPDELVGHNIFELNPDLAEMGIAKAFCEVMKERDIRSRANLKRKDRFGNDIVFNLTGIPILEGRHVKGVIALANDITEKRALESQVAQTEEYLQSLIDNANDIIYILDTNGYITFLNKLGQETTGYRFIPSERAHYSGYVVKRDLAKNERHFQEALKGNPQRFESAILGIDGRVVNVLINITPIRREAAVVGVLGIARDITERKQMEAQLLQASKMAAIGELAAGVAHEINNPVGIISGTAEQLQFLVENSHESPEEIAKRLSKHIETIREQALRCKKITQGLLNFARRSEIHESRVNLPKLVEETIALVENRALAERKTIVTEVAEGVPCLTADPHQLEQVFLNLVNNALDAVERNGTIKVRIRAQGDTVVIEVADDGVGISEDNLKKIFDPFFTTKPIGRGTGLGLSICFGIVQRMNGTISVVSKPGAGSTFTVRLPVTREPI